MSKRTKPVIITYTVGILIFAALIGWSYAIDNLSFVPEMVGFMILITFLFMLYKKLDMTLLILIILILSFIPHTLGFLGFYAKSPIPFFEWDSVTHFFPLFAFSLLFFKFLYKYMNKKAIDINTFLLILVSMLAAAGVGTIVELIEFFGFLIFGFGKGGLAFGAGDALPGQIATTIDEIIKYGGGWYNTMYDLIWNSIGILLGTFIMIFYYYLLMNPDKIKKKISKKK